MKKIVITGILSMLFLVTIHVLPVRAQTQEAEIAETDLTANADAILRKRLTIIEIKDMKSATLKERYVVTILNPQGKDFGHFYGVYYQDQSYSNIKAEVYDHTGKRIKRIQGSDISDMSYVSGASLFDDTRLKAFEVYNPTYPYTVEVEYELNYKGFVSFPRWIPQYSENLAVEEAKLLVIYPEDNPVRYKALNMSEPSKYQHGQDKTRLEWSLSNLPAYKSEPLAPPFHEYMPVVYLAPNEFNFHNTGGKLQTWEDYGSWLASLLVGRQGLPQKLEDEVGHIIKDAKDNPREAARRIYEFMQNHTRYVSIQLGIGGFQPFPADMVAGTGYGDCKALSNYTKALFQIAGIESYYTVIGVSNQSIVFDDFPSLDQTNHAILCVPFETDTVWLECTSQRNPFGYIPRSLQYRKALIVKDKGSTLTDLPSLTAEDNRRDCDLSINIDISGNAQIISNTTFRGILIETVFPEVWQSRKEQLEVLTLRYSNLKGRISEFELKLDTEGEITATENVVMAADNFGSKTGSRIFISAFPPGGSESTLQRIKDRKTDFELEFPYLDKHTITFALPENYRVETLPAPVLMQTAFGNYEIEVSATDSEIVVTRAFLRNKGRYPAAEYNDYVGFRQAISRADRSQIVLIER
jgi:hypothetical protein